MSSMSLILIYNGYEFYMPEDEFIRDIYKNIKLRIQDTIENEKE